MKIGFATYSKKPEINAADQLAANAVEVLTGIKVVAVPWDLTPQPNVDVLVIRSTWDYHYELARFEGWLKGLRCKVLNPVPVLLENLSKTYLKRWEKAGIPIIPTIFFNNEITLMKELEKRKWPELVLKPAVSASSHLAYRLQTADIKKSGAVPKILARSEGLAQPFISDITSSGEISAIYHKERGEKPILSHALRKVPSSGDFRVQMEFGGVASTYFIEEKTLQFCAKVLEQIKGEWLYARVDFIETEKGPLLSELELVEPYLFYEQTGADLAGFAHALRSHLR